MSRSSIAPGAIASVLFSLACHVAVRQPAGATFERDLSAPMGHQTRTGRVGEDELNALPNQSLAQALMRVRPDFLRPNAVRGALLGAVARPSIYIDNAYAGTMEELQLVPTSVVTEVLFLAPSAAHDRFGASCACDAGVLVVTTRRGR